MKVFLCAINARFTHLNLALRYLRNEIEPMHQTVLREYIINQNRIDILEDIAAASPDVVMLSVYIWNSMIVKTLIPDIKKLLPDSKLILGGPEVCYNAQEWLDQFQEIDFIVSGSGEDAVKTLAENDFMISSVLRNGKPKEIVFTNDTLNSFSGETRSFSQIGFPYREEDFAQFNHRYIYYESSRGCPFSCAYCVSSLEDQKLEYKTAAQAVLELTRILSHDPMMIKFVDRTFNSDPQRAREIWQYLADYKSRATFHFEIHPLLLEETDFVFLETIEPEKFRFEIGVQSVNKETLDAVARPVEWQNIRHLIARLIAMKNIYIHLDLIVGLPFENLMQTAKSFDEIISMSPDHFQLGFLKVLPGTSVRSKAEEYGLVYTQDAPYQILQNKWITIEEIALLRRIAALVESVYNSHRFETLLKVAAEKNGGYFAAFRKLADFTVKKDFDVTTKNEMKLREILVSFVSK
jgi:radical SAM superfamily enzyme YgiQ (UPF0313 family)